MTTDPPRIIVELLPGHWSAWWADEPGFSAGGSDPAEAVDRLLQLRDRRPGYGPVRGTH